MTSLDSFKCRKKLKVGTKTYHYYSLKDAEKNGLPGISSLPFSMKVLLENLLRHEDNRSVTKKDIESFVAWLKNKGTKQAEIGFRPARADVPLVAPLDAAHGVNPKEPQTTLEVPSVEVMDAMMKLWEKSKKR